MHNLPTVIGVCLASLFTVQSSRISSSRREEILRISKDSNWHEFELSVLYDGAEEASFSYSKTLLLQFLIKTTIIF